MKIVVFEFEPWERPYFERLERAHQVVFEPARLDAASAAEHADADVVSTFIYSDLGRAVLSRLTRLRLIATRSTGYDHIDMACCAERGIEVANVPHYGENTVAEHVFALLLAISHHIPEAVGRTRQGDFSQAGLQGFDLCGKTLGVIGAGNIGRRTIRIARGFDMEVLAHDPFPDEAAAARLQFAYVGLPELLRRSDVISVHVPADPATHHLLSEPEFAQMKRGVVVINTARGSVIDVRALLQALASGHVAAAGLDVLPEEPAIREEAELLRALFTGQHDLGTLLVDHVLLHARNVLITPHSAFNTREAVQRILRTAVENIEGYLAGEPRNLVGRLTPA
jgi:D-lactate dehydrogenase